MKAEYNVLKLKINKMSDLCEGVTDWFYAGEDYGGYNKELITKDINKAKVFDDNNHVFDSNSFYNTFEDIDNEYECFRLDEITIECEIVRVSRETMIVAEQKEVVETPQVTEPDAEIIVPTPNRILIVKQGVKCTRYDLHNYIDSYTGLSFLDENETVDRYLTLKGVRVKDYKGYELNKDIHNLNRLNKGHGAFYTLTPYIDDDELKLHLTIDWDPSNKIFFIEIVGDENTKSIWNDQLESIELAFTVIPK